MKKSLISRLWHDPVWSKVIAAAVLIAAGAVGSYFQGFWPTIGAAVTRVVLWIQESTLVPNWLLIILSICTVATLIVGGVMLWAIIFPEAGGRGWRAYTTDEFFSIRWRWHYGSDGGVYGLHSFCPACDYQVYAANASAFRAVPRIIYRCEDCGWTLKEFEGTPEELENRVIRAIQKKLRTSTWPKPTKA